METELPPIYAHWIRKKAQQGIREAL